MAEINRLQDEDLQNQRTPSTNVLPADLYDQYAVRRDQETLAAMEAEIRSFDLDRAAPESPGAVETPPPSDPLTLGERAAEASTVARESSLPARAGGAVIDGLISGLPQVAGGALEGLQNSLTGLADLMQFTRESGESAQADLDAANPFGQDLPPGLNDLLEGGADVVQRGIEGGLRELAFLTPQIEKEPGVVPGVVRGISQFLVAFLPGLGMARAAGLGPVASGAAAGAGADLLTTSQTDQNLSNLIETLDPELKDSAITILSIDEGDSSGVARVKTAVEGLVTGGAVDTVLNAKVLANAFVDTLRVVKGSGAELTDTLDEVVAKVQSSVPDNFLTREAPTSEPSDVLELGRPFEFGDEATSRLADAIEDDLVLRGGDAEVSEDFVAALRADPDARVPDVFRVGGVPVEPGGEVATRIADAVEEQLPRLDGRPNVPDSIPGEIESFLNELRGAGEEVSGSLPGGFIRDELSRFFNATLIAEIRPGRLFDDLDLNAADFDSSVDPSRSLGDLHRELLRQLGGDEERLNQILQDAGFAGIRDESGAVRPLVEGAEIPATPTESLTFDELLLSERGAIGRGDPLDEARAQVFDRLSRLDIPDAQKAQIMQGVNGAEDLETILRVDDGLARAEAIEANQAGLEPPPETPQAGRLDQVDVIRREPTVREGAEGIPVEDLRGESRRNRVPIKNLPDTEIELQEFIRRNGGIRLEGEELRGELERLISPRFLGRNPRLQNNRNGISLQEMSERANEAGFTVTADKTSLLEALDTSRNRREVFSEQRSGIVEVLGNPSTRRVYEDLLNFVDDFDGQVDIARRAQDGPRRRAFVHEEAAELVESGLFGREDVRSLLPGTTLNDTETSALVRIMSDAAVEVQQLAQAYVDTGLVVGSDEGKRFALMLGLLADVEPRRQGVLAEAGRSLGILNDPLSSQNRFIAQFQSIFNELPDETLSDVARRVASLPRIDQVARYSTRVAQTVRSGGLSDAARAPSILLEYWVNALLSGPQTHAVNFLSNSLMVPGAILERGLASLVPGGDIPIREPFYMAWGAIQGVGDAFRYIGEGLAERARTAGDEGALSAVRGRRSRFERFVENDLGEAGAELVGEEKFVINQGRSAITGANVADKMQGVLGLRSAGERLAKNVAVGESGLGAFIDLVGEMVRLPTRALGASDDFFKAINYRMELQGQAVRQAYQTENLRGQALTDRVSEIVNAPSDEIARKVHDQAENFAAVQTFTNALGPSGQAAQVLLGRTPLLRPVVPFLKTPINIFVQASRRTPILNLASGAYRADLAAGGSRRAIALSQMAMGTGVFMAAYSGVMAGRVTGGGPRHFGLQQQLKSEGWQPYSIRMGDEWVNYSRLDPVFMPFAIMADFVELVANADPNERGLGDIALAGALSIKDNMLSKTYIRGVSDVVRAINPTSPTAEGSLQAIRRYSGNLVASVLPNVLRQLEGVVDPKIRETYGMIDLMIARIPGLSESLPARRNLWGDEIYLHGGLGPDFVSPLYTTSGEVSLASEVLAVNDYPVRLPPKKVSFPGLETERLELTAEEHEAFMMWSSGRNLDGDRLEPGQDVLQEQIERLDGSAAFKAAPLEDRQDAISAIISSYRTRAKAMLLDEFDELRDRYDEAVEKQQNQIGPGRNELLRRQLRVEASSEGVLVTTP